MREFSRTDRVAEQLKQELAVLVQRDVKDPRLGMITINDAKVSRDLGYADIYFTLLGENDPERVKENSRILKHASGFLRTQVARRMKLRHVPELRFHYDESVARGNKLSQLIDRAVESDQQHHEADGSTDASDSGSKGE
ncbi:Ribosome-binding factor A [Halomonadaceae bacterium LMG 33818]|uniref:30S ribosome-binding factor RbfA n=1 Tax=Cernens ardua TaxID=3402176 RepID=UPI003EDBB7FB